MVIWDFMKPTHVNEFMICERQIKQVSSTHHTPSEIKVLENESPLLIHIGNASKSINMQTEVICAAY